MPGRPAARPQLDDVGPDVARGPRNDARLRQRRAHRLEKRLAGTLEPAARAGIGGIGGNLPIRVEAAEMVEADDVVKLEGRAQAVDPPRVAGAGEVVPVVERVCPRAAPGRKK